MKYPEHLEEKIREVVAISYLKHELKKIFPSINKGDIENLMSNKTLSNPRDFWNGFHGISMGFKLNIGLSFIITAENIQWSKKEILVNDLYFGTKTKELEEIIDNDDLSVINILKNLENKKGIKNKLIENYNQTKVINSDWNKDPIIVKEKIISDQKVLTVYDGHNRLLQAILNGQNKIFAYIGRFKSKELIPKNFWLPTDLIMDNLFFIYESINNNEEKIFRAQIEGLKNMLEKSESGRIEFLERALTKNKIYREKILNALEIKD